MSVLPHGYWPSCEGKLLNPQKRGTLALAQSALPLIRPCLVQAEGLNACKIQSKFFISLIAYMSYHGERKEVNLSIYIFVSITIANVNRTIIHCGDIILRRTRTAVKDRYFFNRNVFYISLEKWKLSTLHHPRRRKFRENSLLRANNGLTTSDTKRCNFIAFFYT